MILNPEHYPSHNEQKDEESVRGKLIFAVSSLTRLLGAEQLQKKGEVITNMSIQYWQVCS